jgi:hypothetical protein
VQWDGGFSKVREALSRMPDQLLDLRPTWVLKPGVFHTLGSRTLVMGILNVTEDSFSDGGTCSLCGSSHVTALSTRPEQSMLLLAA